ncbi:MAG: hypothetical protein ACI8RT_000370 [Candidatus Azotimanducaceae bacterium]
MSARVAGEVRTQALVITKIEQKQKKQKNRDKDKRGNLEQRTNQ